MKIVVMVMTVAGLAASLVQRAHAASCPNGTVSVELTSVGDLLDLAGALDCTGEVAYEVTWHGRLRIQRVIEVSDRKTMTVTGSNDTQPDGTATSGAYNVIDAGNTSGMFRVTNGSTLTLNSLALAGGYSEESGGAVELDSYSSLNVVDCEFTENRGEKGGAIFANDSEVYISGTTYFRHNSGDVGATGRQLRQLGIAEQNAGDKGAVYAYNSRVDIDGNAQFAYNSADSGGGAVYAVSGSTIVIDGNAQFARNSADFNGGAVHAISGSTIVIDGDAQFANNAAAEDGGAVYASNSTIAINGNAQFTDNSAEKHGGALYVSDSKVNIDGGSQFVNNSVTDNGGGIYSSNSFPSKFAFAGETMFGENVAMGDGGAMHVGSMDEVNITDIAFTSNTADQGGAVFVAPSSNGLLRRYNSCNFSDNSATSGGAIYFSGGDVGYDHISASTFDGNYASTSGGAIYLLTGGLGVDSSEFIANQAGEEGMAIASVSFLTPMNFSNVAFDGNSLYCPLGQYGSYEYTDPVAAFLMVCEGCSAATNEVPDTVSVDQDTPVCYQLPTGTVARSAGTTLQSITLAAGYYRTSDSSDIMLRCHRIEACPGGNDPQTYCAAGYQGVCKSTACRVYSVAQCFELIFYCATCSDGYSPGLDYSCRLCSEGDKTSAGGMACAVAVAALLSTVVVLRHLGKVVDADTTEESGTSQGVVRRTCASFQGLLMKALPLTAIKIVVVVWQIVFQFAAIAKDVYPEEYKAFLAYVSFAIFDISYIVSYSCLFFPDFYGRLLLMTIAPLLVLIVLAVAYYVAIGNFHRANQHLLMTSRNRHLSAALFVAFFVYSSVSSTIFQTFLCEDVGGISHLTADYSILCGNKWHDRYKVYAAFMIVLYPIGIPAVFCWWLVRNRTNLNMPDRHTIAYLQPFSSIWGTYRRSRYYYEVVEYCRRLTLSMSSVFLVPNSVNQIAVVLSLAAVFMFVSESLSPFERSVDMSLYRWGNVIILASMYIALLMKANESEEDFKALSVFGWVLVTANVMLIVSVAVQAVLLAQHWRAEQPTVEHAAPPVRRGRFSAFWERVRPGLAAPAFASKWRPKQTTTEQIIPLGRRLPSSDSFETVRSSHTASIFARNWRGKQTRVEQILPPVRRPSAVGSEEVGSSYTAPVFDRNWRAEETRVGQIIPRVFRPTSVRSEDAR